MSSISIYTFKNCHKKLNYLPLVPYTYVVTHIASGKRYYGANYSSNAHPSTFFKNHFTSSKVVKTLLESEGIKAFSFEIRKTFTNKKDCLNYYHKVLRRLKITN
jgi:hypothetical protein